MKIAGLIIGIILTLLAAIGTIVFLLLPSMTNNRVDFEESALGLIASIPLFFIGLVITIVSAILYFRARKKAI